MLTINKISFMIFIRVERKIQDINVVVVVTCNVTKNQNVTFANKGNNLFKRFNPWRLRKSLKHGCLVYEPQKNCCKPWIAQLAKLGHFTKKQLISDSTLFHFSLHESQRSFYKNSWFPILFYFISQCMKVSVFRWPWVHPPPHTQTLWTPPFLMWHWCCFCSCEYKLR